MSEHRYARVFKIDKENSFVASFDGNTGYYIRSGILKDINDLKSDTDIDPFKASFPELIDIGIMEICVCSSKCKVDCYQKACDRTGPNMSLENYASIIDQCKGKTLQVALGGAGDPDTHENFAEILEYTAKANIVPNFTTSGIAMTKEKAALCKKYCGAVAVSEHFEEYTDKAIKCLLDAGVKTNIHYVLNKDTIKLATQMLLGEVEYRPGINAVVFLMYKPVGLGVMDKVLTADNPDVEEFFKALDKKRCKFKVGFDSCSCSGIVNFSKNIDWHSIDYCEGGRFSMYISADMTAMPCSFANQDKNWHYKLDSEHKIKDAWNSEIFEKFRNTLKNRCPGCKSREACAGGCPLMDSICLCNRPERTV